MLPVVRINFVAVMCPKSNFIIRIPIVFKACSSNYFDIRLKSIGIYLGRCWSTAHVNVTHQNGIPM